MKILFRNTTKYDKDNRENFINFHKNKYGKKEVTKALILIICILYMILFNLMNLNWQGLIVLVILVVIYYFVTKIIISKRKEKNKKQKNREFTFFFYERYIKIKSKRQFERMSYFEIKKIFETENNFFLYTDDKHSLILDKEGFSIGTSKEFSEFIKRKCPFKYKNN